jgi:hypothetical protein
MKTKLLRILALYVSLSAAVAQPIITLQPQWQTNIIGATATFSVGATGTPPLLYQWRKATADLPTQTNSTLVFTNLQSSQQALYSVVVSNVDGAVTSSVARLYVRESTITPAAPTASLFADLTLVGTHALDAPFTYEWLFNGVPIAGAVTNRLVLTNVQKTNAGDYAFVINYTFGSVTSAVATLKIVPFNSIYFFGYSWTDTHNCAANWPPPDFYDGRACNGPMWPEFLSTNLGLAYVEANNYAHCGASAPAILNQVISFPPPPQPQFSLYCTWANGPDVPPDPTTWTEQILQTTIQINSNMVDRLYAKGARTIVVQLDPQVEKLPGYAIDYGGPVASNYFAHFNTNITNVLSAYTQTKPDLRVIFVDTYSKLNDVIANPGLYGFTKTTVGAKEDTALVDQSFTGPGADYVFWNRLHGTSKLNEYEFKWTIEALTKATPETLEVTIVPVGLELQFAHLLIGRDYTLQRSIDLSHWSDVQTFTAAAGTNQITQAAAGDASVFYRMQWQP